MPKIVDHDAQRLTFADAAMRLIARHGIEGVTMRAVAAEAGLSYGSLFHYFDSKDDLLMHAVRQLTSSQTSRVNEYESQYSGLKALEHLLCDDAIVNDASRDYWMVWLTFQYKVALDDAFAELHADLVRGWLERIEGLLSEAREAGEVSRSIDVETESMALWAYSVGVGQLGLLHPESMSPGRQKDLISTYLDKIRAD